jgi:hypothetical protein
VRQYTVKVIFSPPTLLNVRLFLQAPIHEHQPQLHPSKFFFFSSVVMFVALTLPKIPVLLSLSLSLSLSPRFV